MYFISGAQLTRTDVASIPADINRKRAVLKFLLVMRFGTVKQTKGRILILLKIIAFYPLKMEQYRQRVVTFVQRLNKPGCNCINLCVVVFFKYLYTSLFNLDILPFCITLQCLYPLYIYFVCNSNNIYTSQSTLYLSDHNTNQTDFVSM